MRQALTGTGIGQYKFLFINQSASKLRHTFMFRKANFATRPFLKLSEEVQDFLDTHSQHTDNTGSIASHYSASDRPEAGLLK